jgi:hypothetical protein
VFRGSATVAETIEALREGDQDRVPHYCYVTDEAGTSRASW